MPDYDSIVDAVINNKPIPDDAVNLTHPVEDASFITHSDHSFEVFSEDKKKDK